MNCRKDTASISAILFVGFLFLTTCCVPDNVPQAPFNSSPNSDGKTTKLTQDLSTMESTIDRTLTPTSVPYDPFLNWSEEPNGKVEIHYDFTKMTKEEVKKYFEVNRNDFTLNAEGLHWVIDGKNANAQNAEFTLWPLAGIKNDITDVNISKVVIYFSLSKTETYHYYDDIKNSVATFPESTFFSHFECSSPIYPIRILSGANKTWLHSINDDSENPWGIIRTLPDYVRLSSGGSGNADSYYDWEKRYFIALIPFKYDTKNRPWIKDEYLFLQVSNTSFDFADYMKPVDNNIDLFDSDAWKWKGFDCLYPKLRYIGFRSEIDSGINATIHNIYILGKIKQAEN